MVDLTANRRFSLAEFLHGQPLAEYVQQLPADQPDFPMLLQEASISAEAVARFRSSGASYAAVVTEPWCFDSLHALPLLVRLQEAVPELEARVWVRSADPELALRIADEPMGSKPPAVPHVTFYDAGFSELGHFRERPESVTRWLEDESRKFRTRLRMQERQRVRAETLDGLISAALPGHPGRPRPALTVLEFWAARDPAHRDDLSAALRRHMPALNAIPGVRGVEFTELKDRPGQYAALFHYEHEGVRADFLSSEAVRRMRAEVDPLWTRVSESTWSYAL